MLMELLAGIPFVCGLAILLFGRQLSISIKALSIIHAAGILLGAAVCGWAVAAVAANWVMLGLGNVLFLDSLGAYQLVLVEFVICVSGLSSIRYILLESRNNGMPQPRAWQFYLFFQWLSAALMFICVIGDFGGLWIGIELATLFSAILIASYGQKNSVETAWKYLLIGSVGAAFALFGLILLYDAAYPVFGYSVQGLRFPTLLAHAGQMNVQLLKISFAFVLVGLGVKAGLAPMHLWLSDAHAHAPSPIAAMLSGTLLTSAMYGIFRYYIILEATSAERFASGLLIGLGLISVAAVLPYLYFQRNLKRVFAFSSVGQMGAVAAAVGIGGALALVVAMQQMLFHALLKTALFCSIQDQEDRLPKITRPFRMPFLLGGLALIGMPPFGLFVSEYELAAGSFTIGGSIWIALLMALLLLMGIAFARPFAKSVSLHYRQDQDEAARPKVQPAARLSVLLISIPLAAALAGGWYQPSWFQQLLENTAVILGAGGR